MLKHTNLKTTSLIKKILIKTKVQRTAKYKKLKKISEISSKLYCHEEDQ